MSTHFFTILGEDRDSGHSEAWLLSRWKVFVDRVVSHTSLFPGIPLYRKQHLPDRPWLFGLGYLTDIFSKINELRLSCPGKQEWLPIIKFEFSGEKQNFGNLVSNTMSQTTSQYLQTSLMSSVAKWQMWFCGIMWWKCQHLEELPNPENQYFPNDQWMMAQNLSWVKDPFKFKMAPWIWMYWSMKCSSMWFQIPCCN